MTTNSQKEYCNCKIGRSQRKYDLYSLDADLQMKREKECASLRDLARFVDIQILNAAISETEADLIGDAASIYDAITSEDVSTERQVVLTDQLRNQNLNMDELRNDFVSYQTVRHHFQNCLGIATDRRGVDTVKEASEVIQWSRERHENIAERTLGRLNRNGVIHLENASITSSLTISCEDCGAIYSIDEFLSRTSCEC